MDAADSRPTAHCSLRPLAGKGPGEVRSILKMMKFVFKMMNSVVWKTNGSPTEIAPDHRSYRQPVRELGQGEHVIKDPGGPPGRQPSLHRPALHLHRCQPASTTNLLGLSLGLKFDLRGGVQLRR